MSFRIILSTSANKVRCDFFFIEIVCIESVGQSEEYCRFNGIKSLNMRFLFRSLHSFDDILQFSGSQSALPAH